MFCVYSLVSIRTDARRLVVFRAVVVRTVVERAIVFAHWSATPLVHEVPVEAYERPVLIALMLQERLALLDAKLLQVSEHTQ